MKVVLIVPPSSRLFEPRMHVPLGALHVAGSLRAAGIEVQICDASLPNPLPNADIVGVTATTAQYYYARAVAREVKGALTVIGGPHATSLPMECLDDFDIAVVGEGEETLVEIAKGKPLPSIQGIAYRSGTERFRNRERGFIRDLDSIPLPAYDLWPELGSFALVRSSGTPTGKGVNIISSRGCPYDCAFCDTEMWRRIVRYRSVSDVISEVKLLQSYGVSQFRFVDDTFALDKKRLRMICLGLGELGVIWRCHTRVAGVSEADYELMRDAGCVEVGLGIESGSDAILRNMNKKTTVAQSRQAILKAKAAGLKVRAYVVIGFPGETEETIEQTKRFLLETRPDMYTLSTCVPYPGSDLWNHPEKYGVKIKSRNFDDYWLVGLEDSDRGFMLDLPTLTEEQLVRARAGLTEILDAELMGRAR